MVKEKQVASGIRAFSWGAHDPGMISIDGTVARGKTVEEYEAALAEALADLSNLEDQELNRIKNSIETQYVLERTGVLNRAMILAMSDVLGNPEFANTSLEQYLKLTAADIRAAATEFLAPTNCSTLYYLPKA
jgi:predicted Zn-dependent peptidase